MAHGFLLILPLVLAIALIRRGFRGAAIDDHPLCRACGFDLFGQQAGTSICSECGRDLSKPKAIVVGHRQKRLNALGFGIALLIVSAGWLGIAGYGRVKQVNWWHHAPLWYVLREASSDDVKRHPPALAELMARSGTAVASETRYRILEAGLAYQGDGEKAWDPQWGEFLEGERHAGFLSDQQWNRYLVQAWKNSVTFKLRKRVRMGDRLPYSVEFTSFRTSRDFGRWYPFAGIDAQLVDDHLTWPGSPPPDPREHGWVLISSGGGGRGSSLDASDFPRDFAPGEHTIYLEATVVVRQEDFEASNQAVPIISEQIKIPGTFVLLPEDQFSVKLLHDPSLAPAIQKCIKVEPEHHDWGDDEIYVSLAAPPTGLSFNLVVRIDGKETKLGTIGCPANGKQRIGFNCVGWKLPVGKSIDLILRGNPKSATEMLDVFEAWDGEIVLKDVPVK
jgi:hypothetical protein